jgi:hypothetical protein
MRHPDAGILDAIFGAKAQEPTLQRVGELGVVPPK